MAKRTLKLTDTTGVYTFVARTGEAFTVRRVPDERGGGTWVARGARGTFLDSLYLVSLRARLIAL